MDNRIKPFGFHEVEEAKKYLMLLGQYELVVKGSMFGGQDFEIIIAANSILESNDAIKEKIDGLHKQ